MQALDERLDRRTIWSAGGRAVRREPAVLVQRDPHGVDAPADHRADRGPVGAAAADAPSFCAGPLAPGPVDAEQAHAVAAVDEPVAFDMEPDGRSRAEKGLVGRTSNEESEDGERGHKLRTRAEKAHSRRV